MLLKGSFTVSYKRLQDINSKYKTDSDKLYF